MLGGIHSFTSDVAAACRQLILTMMPVDQKENLNQLSVGPNHKAGQNLFVSLLRNTNTTKYYRN